MPFKQKQSCTWSWVCFVLLFVTIFIPDDHLKYVVTVPLLSTPFSALPPLITAVPHISTLLCHWERKQAYVSSVIQYQPPRNLHKNSIPMQEYFFKGVLQNGFTEPGCHHKKGFTANRPKFSWLCQLLNRYSKSNEDAKKLICKSFHPWHYLFRCDFSLVFVTSGVL